jgi:hypothetical protein
LAREENCVDSDDSQASYGREERDGAEAVSKDYVGTDVGALDALR